MSTEIDNFRHISPQKSTFFDVYRPKSTQKSTFFDIYRPKSSQKSTFFDIYRPKSSQKSTFFDIYRQISLFIFSLSAVLFFSSLVIQSDLEGQVRFVDFLANNENATPDVLHLVAQSLDQPGIHNQAKIIIQVQSNYDFSILINLACLCNVSVALSLGLMFHTIPEISVMPESHKHWKMSLKISLSWKVT